MTTTIHDTTTDQRTLRYGGLILMALLWLSGCAGQTGSATPATAMLAPSAPPVLLADASPAQAVAADVTEKSSDGPFDPFAKSGEEGVEEYDPWETLNTRIFEFNRQVGVNATIARGIDQRGLDVGITISPNAEVRIKATKTLLSVHDRI